MRVLIVQRDLAIARALERMLRNEHVTTAPNAVTADGYDLVLGDRPMTWEALCEAMANARVAQRRRDQRKPRTPRRHEFVTQEL